MSQHLSQKIDDYEACITAVREAVAGLSHNNVLARPIPGRWSTLEVVCHLVDSEVAWTHRMKRVIVETQPLLIGYDESCFTRGLYYQEANLIEELNLFAGLRSQMARLLRKLPAEAWERTGVHNERGLVNLAEMLQIEIDHVHHHLRHVHAKREALAAT